MVAHRCKTYLVGGSFFPFLFFGGGGVVDVGCVMYMM